MHKGLIYCYTNNINNKRYIGYTLNEKQRKKEHLSLRSTCPYFKKALKKYGKEAFTYSILYKRESSDIDNLIKELHKKEIYFIKKYNSNDKLYGYNLTNGGEGTSGYKRKLSDETKLLISSKLKISNNKTITPNGRKRLSELNSNLTAEEVVEIKKFLKTEKSSILAIKYNVSKYVIYRIKKGISWKHLNSSGE